MIHVTDKFNCCGCHACFEVCPTNCIEMQADSEGFLYPHVHVDNCINCHKCEKACPILNKVSNHNTTRAFAVQNKDENVRLASSSGGMFTLLADYVIDNDGIVIGAAFDDNLELIHIATNNKSVISKLREAKYIQSKIADTFNIAKDCLEQGKLVLFTGTPCQISGLLNTLNHSYDNLITQDIICHGVPSPKVWNEYVKHLNKKFHKEIINVQFRNKDSGWKSYSLKYTFSDGSDAISLASKDPYMLLFLNNLSLRPSCYACHFKGLDRPSDFTLADFWGIKNILPQIDDDKGTSLVFVNTEKGHRIFELLSEKNLHFEVDITEAVKYNTSAINSANEPTNRAQFMNQLSIQPFTNLSKKFVPKRAAKSLLKHLIRKLKLMLNSR